MHTNARHVFFSKSILLTQRVKANQLVAAPPTGTIVRERIGTRSENKPERRVNTLMRIKLGNQEARIKMCCHLAALSEPPLLSPLVSFVTGKLSVRCQNKYLILPKLGQTDNRHLYQPIDWPFIIYIYIYSIVYILYIYIYILYIYMM